MRFHSNAQTRAPIANAPNSAQLEGTRTPSYIRVRAVVHVGMRRWTARQTHRQTDGRAQYTFRLGFASRKM